jgi:hypothetical protein
LALLDRCWTWERFQRHNLQNSGPCALCSQEDETIHHLLLGCCFSHEVWYRLLRLKGLQAITPPVQCSLPDWWMVSPKHVHKAWRKSFDIFVVLTCWHLWRERNVRIFDHTSKRSSELVAWIKDVGKKWSLAGFRYFLDEA